MLIETMTELEVHNEVIADFKFLETDLNKVYLEYHTLRKKLKIEKHSPFVKHFEITSKRNNRWLVIVGKNPSKNYKSINDVASQEVTYYYNKIGYRAFNVLVDLKQKNPIIGLGVFNGHFFSRYNERLGLGLIKPTDVLINYFLNNHDSSTQVIEGSIKSYGICRDGILLGVYKHYRDFSWLLHRTFITHKMKRQDQLKFETRLISEMKNEYNKGKQATVHPHLLKLFENC